jgi:hypothetical protein
MRTFPFPSTPANRLWVQYQTRADTTFPPSLVTSMIRDVGHADAATSA